MEKNHKFDIELSAPCNAKCYFCPQSWNGVKRDKPFLSKELILKIIKDLEDLSGIVNIAFVGMGEPLLKKDLMLYFLENIKKDNFTFGTQTNGYHLTKDFLENPLTDKLNWISVSITGWDSYESIYKLNPDIVRNNVIEAAKIIGNKLSITWVDDPKIDKSELEKMKEWHKKYLEPYNVSFSMNELHTRGGHYEYPGAFDNGIRKFKNCGIFRYVNFISSSGHVVLCCMDVDSSYKIADISKESISSILDKKKKIQTEESGFDICNKCNSFAYLTPVEIMEKKLQKKA